MFRIGDAVIHPGFGAGTVIDIEKLQFLGSDKPYYSIELSDGSKTRVWIPVRDAEKRGVRHPTPRSQLGQIWRVLRAEPETLPPDHNERHESLQERLRGGDIFQIAEAVRDMFWKDHRSRRLTVKGKRLYERGLMLLTSQVAVVQGCDFAVAEAKISHAFSSERWAITKMTGDRQPLRSPQSSFDNFITSTIIPLWDEARLQVYVSSTYAWVSESGRFCF